jgi:hypothetical protein
LNIFFDCDYTIITWDGKLRPGVTQLFQRLKDDGHTIYVWSGAGIRWYDVRKHGLLPYVTDCFHKPLYDYKKRMVGMGVTTTPDLVIDDYPDIVSALGGIRVKPYVFERRTDTEMERVYHIISALNANGRSHDTSDGHPPSDPP